VFEQWKYTWVMFYLLQMRGFAAISQRAGIFDGWIRKTES
jgi:hypothetical protein